MRADSCVSVCQPSLVLPPLFDSNAVELQITQGVRHAYYIYICFFDFYIVHFKCLVLQLNWSEASRVFGTIILFIDQAD